ncbi:RagB/SusD family nutrient uptake outer membrane protein [Parapedobacter sp. DT-150]|uniref:RagB/SusD family nutrient uptake outer membrane protein n=1 Tax=Parapedobacter sp. DT-150 TaxID=3396162 RepID=UPI003F1BAEB2
MKMHQYVALIGLFTILLSSCEKDFLERAPLNSLSDADFWKTENDMKVYTNSFYNSLLPTYSGYTQTPFLDDANYGSDTYIRLDYNRRMNGEGTLPSAGGGWSAGDWSQLRNINYFLDHCYLIPVSEDVIKKYAGEALFFRSLFYYSKIRIFGDVPWVSTTVQLDSELLYAPRTPRNEVVDSIMRDLDLAVEYLPARGGGSWTGRITKEAALALQARIALYEGTWEKYHALKNTPFKVTGSDGTKFIQKAADAAAALMAMAETNGYPALDNVGAENGYWLLFNRKDYSNSKEVLFWRKYSVADGQTTHRAEATFRGAGSGLTKGLVDSYLCLDGQPIAVSPLYQGDEDLRTLVTNRDPRLNQTVQVDDGQHFIWENPRILFTVPVFEGSTEFVCTTGYQLYKGHSADNTEYTTAQSTTGTVYFRYAETLLIYAEAKAELGTITQSDIDQTVNALRSRVGMVDGLLDIGNITTDPNWEFSGLSPLLQEIRRERKVELACEGLRVDDIHRWAAADELIVGKRPLGAIKKQWDNYPGASDIFLEAVTKLPVDAQGYIDPYQPYSIMDAGYQFNLGRDYLSPIPTDQLVLNPSLLPQNPGW